MNLTAPMLAERCALTKIRYPILATPKIDGIRCLKVNGRAVTRSFKLLPNIATRRFIESLLPDGVDGELIVPGKFNAVESAFMSQGGRPDFQYMVFDFVPDNTDKPYQDRVKELVEAVNVLWEEGNDTHPRVMPLLPSFMENESQLLDYEEECINLGYEGVVFRSLNSPYKCGRSTVREGYMLKLKRFLDSEAEVIGFERLQHNTNGPTLDAFGHVERSSRSEGMVDDNLVGALLVRDLKSGTEFRIGSGFTAELRAELYQNWELYRGRIITYKHFPHGAKDKPRHPVFKNFRSLSDM